MKKVHSVIYQEIAPPALIALAVLTFVVFTREFGRFTELLIRRDADALTIFEVVIYLLPSILIFTVPIAFLVGTLVGFSRLSAESEVVAMRAGGVGIYQILRPVLKVALGVCLTTLVLTLFLLPLGNWRLRLLRHEIGVRPVQSQIKPRVFNEDLSGMLLYVDDVDLQDHQWKGVFLAERKEQGQNRIILAREGQVVFGADPRQLQLSLTRAASYEYNQSDPRKYSLSSFGTLDVSARLPEIGPAAEKPKRSGDKTLGELLTDLRQAAPEERLASRVELHRRIALPLSALIFGVLGVTLGITTRRGGRGYGSLVSIVVAFLYYILFASGTLLAGQSVINITLGVWGANILLAVAALISLRFARVGFPITRAIMCSEIVASVATGIRRAFQILRRWVFSIRSGIGSWLWSLSGLRLRLARVVDLYMIRIFLFNVLPTLGLCVALFYLFTFFELIDDVFAHDVSYATLLEYFLYLLPHVLMLLVPISVLIAALTTFGVLEKTLQIVAFKASGISLYRLALPVLVFAAVVSGSVFVLQEYVLPFANQRQDNLRNVIKGQPPQTFYQPGQNWIFGAGHRLYNYNYFDPEHSLFAELSIFEMDIQSDRLVQHTYAQRAEWVRPLQKWRLFNGWTRDLQSSEGAFERFATIDLSVPEKPDYFVQEVKESTKMTFGELEHYIEELQQGGFEVDHLRTELNKKLSFPLVSVVMVMLGIPFAFTIGKKGALYGIAAGVLLGIFYWGAFGVFEVLGTNGFLSPLLAAWGPNLLFGSVGIFLLLNLKK